jgi:SAM-dependent methyltransferase
VVENLQEADMIMIRKVLGKILYSTPVAKLLIRPVLLLHSRCYQLAGRYGAMLNEGVHPKHHIIRYKEWFLENIKPHWTVLDIGCNTGMMPFLLAEKVGFVYGIEVVEHHLATATKDHSRPNIEYICADATTYDYSQCRPIHCVTLSNVLEHVEHRLEFLRRLLGQVQWADPGHKRFLIRVPAIDRDWIVLYKKEMGIEYRSDRTHYTEFTAAQLQEELTQTGITARKVEVRFGEIYAVCEAASP